MSWRVTLGLAFLAAQLVYRWPFTWAPFHEHAVYRLSMKVAGRTIGTKALLDQFRLPTWHFSPARDENWETNDLRDVVEVITRSHPAQPVTIEGTRNGAPFRIVVPGAGERAQ